MVAQLKESHGQSAIHCRRSVGFALKAYFVSAFVQNVSQNIGLNE
jgi:hypothetical protein